MMSAASTLADSRFWGGFILGAVIAIGLLLAALDWTSEDDPRAEPVDLDPSRLTTGGARPVFAHPWSGTLAVEGKETTDGRSLAPGALRCLAPGALRWEVPIPLFSTAEDRVVGRVDHVWRDGDVVRARGLAERPIPSLPLAIEVSADRYSLDGEHLPGAPVDLTVTTIRLDRARLRRVALVPTAAFLEARTDR